MDRMKLQKTIEVDSLEKFKEAIVKQLKPFNLKYQLKSELENRNLKPVNKIEQFCKVCNETGISQ